MHGMSSSPRIADAAGTILVVAGDDALNESVARELSDHGYWVRKASGVEEATRVLLECQPQVLLASHQLEQGDGVGLLQSVSGLSPRTRSIFFGEGASARNIQEAMDAGAVSVVYQPFEPGGLVRAVEHAVECESGFRGFLHGLSLIDLMQMFHLTRRSIRLNVQDGNYRGTVSFQNGVLIDARWRQKSGVEALASLLASTYGTVSSSPLGNPEQTIYGSFDSVVLDTLRRLDEGGPPSKRYSSQSASWKPSSFPPDSFSPVPETLVPSSEEERLAMFCRVVEQARGATLSDDWPLEVIDDLETSIHPAAKTAALALAVDPTSEHIELLSAESAVGVVLIGNYAAVVSTEPAGLQAGQHFRTQFARFSTMVRVNFRVRRS